MTYEPKSDCDLEIPYVTTDAPHPMVTVVWAKKLEPEDRPTAFAELAERHQETMNQLLRARDAFTKISKGMGPFSLDRLEHAENTIEAMRTEALEEIEAINAHIKGVRP